MTLEKRGIEYGMNFKIIDVNKTRSEY